MFDKMSEKNFLLLIIGLLGIFVVFVFLFFFLPRNSNRSISPTKVVFPPTWTPSTGVYDTSPMPTNNPTITSLDATDFMPAASDMYGFILDAKESTKDTLYYIKTKPLWGENQIISYYLLVFKDENAAISSFNAMVNQARIDNSVVGDVANSALGSADEAKLLSNFSETDRIIHVTFIFRYNNLSGWVMGTARVPEEELTSDRFLAYSYTIMDDIMKFKKLYYSHLGLN